MSKTFLNITAAAAAILAITAAQAQITTGRNSADVAAETIAASHAPDQNVVGDSRVNSRVISTMTQAEAAVQARQGSAVPVK